MSDFIKTFYTEEAYLNAEKGIPFVGYILEDGRVAYIDIQKFTNDFSDDFDLINVDAYRKYFNFYR